MPKDENMDVRIAILEAKVNDLLGKAAQLQREMATTTDIANVQRQLDGLQRQIETLQSESERLRAEAEARIDQRFESAFKQFATKAEVRKDLLTFALGIITVQTAINAAMLMIVVHFLR